MASDLYCPTCGEPYSVYHLHDVAEDEGVDFTEVYDRFMANGCIAVGGRCPDEIDDEAAFRGEVFAMLAEIGDLDGAMSDMDMLDML